MRLADEIIEKYGLTLDRRSREEQFNKLGRLRAETINKNAAIEASGGSSSKYYNRMSRLNRVAMGLNGKIFEVNLTGKFEYKSKIAAENDQKAKARAMAELNRVRGALSVKEVRVESIKWN